MSGGIEDIAKTWLRDPPWQIVFKHTFDVLEDYVSYVLIAIGAISLSVRLLTTLGTGDVTCIVTGVGYNNTHGEDLDPYPSGGTLGMISYASTDESCIRAALSIFMEYMPYIVLLQSLILGTTETRHL